MLPCLYLFRLSATVLLCANLSLGEGAPAGRRKLHTYLDNEERSSRNLHYGDAKAAEALLEAEKDEMNLQVVKEMFDLESGFPSGHRDLTQIYRASEYMLGLYNRVADNRTGNLLATRTAVKAKGPSEPTEVIRSISCKDAKEHRGNWRLSFNTAQLPPTNIGTNKKTDVFYAELALFRKSCNRPTNLDRKAARKGWRTEIKVVAQQHPDKESVDNLFRVDSDYLPSRDFSDCWQTFNVTAAVRNWQQRRHRGLRHLGLLLRKQKRDARTLDSHFQLIPGVNAFGRRPVLVVYFGKPVHTKKQARMNQKPGARMDQKPGVHYRQKRAAKAFPVANPKDLKEKNNLQDQLTMRQTDKDNSLLYKECTKYDYFIDFETVGWNRWVVAPAGYKAYRCAGSCAFPIGKNIRTTNHAKLEAFLTFLDHLKGKSLLEVPGAGVCCVPTSHKEISMIYLDESGDTRIKIFKKMVADRCGCR